jgi:hypothetical protein
MTKAGIPSFTADTGPGGGATDTGAGHTGDSIGGGDDPGERGRRSRVEAQKRADAKRAAALGDPDPEVNVPVGRRRDTITRFGANLRANLRANPLNPLATLVQTSFQTNKAQQMMGLPGFSAQFGNPTRNEEGDVPLWMQLGYGSEAEYNAAMGRGVATSAPVESDPPVNLNRMAYRLMAEGGVAMDDEPRQAYGLGSIVKKATRAIKKVAKSPIGKAAILYAGAAGLGALGTGTGFTGFKAGLLSPSTLARNLAISGKGFLTGVSGGAIQFPGAAVASNAPGAFGLGEFLRTPKGAMLGIGALSALPLLGIGVEDEEEQPETSPYLTAGLDIDAIRANPRAAQGRAFRLQIAEGGSTEKEPVAKKVMPLIDMDGKEKDYRETGGFVDMGRMEKADDVPARLSKNEFVFTADAVRNAGDGSVDKGAEVMYNMMKNLEAGGEVSEESQGLEGARQMFQTSQRLEEVL